MRVAYIHGSVGRREEFEFYIDYLKITGENEKSYFLEDDEDGERGISPRGDFLSKELDYEAADDGYSSLYMPGWIKCNSYEVSGSIYALENELEKGKSILKEALLNTLDKEITHLQLMKTMIEKG